LRPANYTEHVSHVDGRRRDLAEKLEGIIGPGDRFVWEVGSGHGHYLAAFAAAHPQSRCIGIDITSDRVVRAERKRSRARLDNLHFIRAEASDFLAVLPPRCRFTAVFILFPDPWPKRRHHKNRVLTADFLSAVANFTEKGASLFFRTDHEPYYSASLALVAGHPAWSVGGGPWPFEEPTVFQKRAARHFSLVAVRK
jgi:tRNA (guanine-N7-)-methyltransferase